MNLNIGMSSDFVPERLHDFYRRIRAELSIASQHLVSETPALKVSLASTLDSESSRSWHYVAT